MENSNEPADINAEEQEIKTDINKGQENNNEIIESTEEKREFNLEKSLELKTQANKCFTEGRINEALDLYEDAVELCPDSEKKTLAVLYSNMGICYSKHNDWESVIEYTTKAIEFDESYAKPYKNRGDAYYKQEKYEECLHDYKKAMELNPKDYSIQALINMVEKKHEEDMKKKTQEVFGSLKKMGEGLLNKFGLSLDNFKVQQGDGGAYNISFQK